MISRKRGSNVAIKEEKTLCTCSLFIVASLAANPRFKLLSIPRPREQEATVK